MELLDLLQPLEPMRFSRLELVVLLWQRPW
jgi:hypothetical protein